MAIALQATVRSVNVGLAREWQWQGTTVISAIDKRPVAGAVPLHWERFAGDEQADHTVHGGLEKAVYVYPAAHYSRWREELRQPDLPYGMFGENLTVDGLDEAAVHVGDRFRVGTAEVLVTQPRLPCYKLGMRFGTPRFLKHFLQSRRTGFYCAVLREGAAAAGDEFLLLARDAHGVTIADVVRLYLFEKDDVDGLRRAATATALPAWWREEFRGRLEALERRHMR